MNINEAGRLLGRKSQAQLRKKLGKNYQKYFKQLSEKAVEKRSMTK